MSHKKLSIKKLSIGPAHRLQLTVSEFIWIQHIYVGETGRSLRSRINGHRAGIIKNGQSLLYKHFRLAGHSVADMKVQILEKIYHSSENPVNIRLHRRLRELHWIKELGTAAPYRCNDQIKGAGTLSSPSCKHTNVLGIFNKQQRRKRSHV